MYTIGLTVKMSKLPSRGGLTVTAVLCWRKSLFRLLPLSIKYLDTMNSRNYGQVDVDFGETMASSKLH